MNPTSTGLICTGPFASFSEPSMFRTCKVPEFTPTIAFTHFWASLLLMTILLWTIGECGSPEHPAPSVEPVPVAPGPPPPPQEQLLTPIPKQFDWMRREVRPNPLLEPILQLRQVTPRLLMSISLIEEYSDNFFLSATDPQDVYRTSLNLGTVYRVESGRSFVSLANSMRGSYDAGAGQGAFAFANLSLNAGYELPRLSLALSESFLRSDEPEDATPVGVQRQRQPFSQNIVTPQLRYALTPTTALNGAYTNTLVWTGSVEQDNTDPLAGNQGSAVENSVSHAFNVGLQQQISRDLSGGASYTFSLTNRQDSSDTQSHAASADLAYIINPRMIASFRIFGTLIDQSQGTSDINTGETDAQIFGSSFGVRRQLTSSLAAFAAVGPTLVKREGLPTRVFANWQVGLDGILPLTRSSSMSFSTQQSINDTAGDINDVGLVSSRSATLTLNHLFSRDLLASIFANVTQTETLEEIATNASTQGQDFLNWSTGARISYALTPLWSLSATYRYQHNDSDMPNGSINGTGLGGNYSESRVIFSLTAAFPVF
jgi:opacity protein-like surface antigen